MILSKRNQQLWQPNITDNTDWVKTDEKEGLKLCQGGFILPSKLSTEFRHGTD